ncbi:hypothetical protein fugu_004804 [Takifugu bimaculatus]|uniref:UBA domain-containing protein n=1 Tax=Takifugu bimaculatus TaxID=433685 RepID=A0A4Z2BBU3_9TELE|nr:hypothetical protein fugu_004804 [Takifugu bimaculatus]
MSSLGSDKARGPREKALAAATHTTQPQKQIQATAEQIRLAQVIYDKNDADFEDKVNQLMEVTGKNQDECMVALHDCNEDVGRAINFLLESTSDMTSWETVGKKKPLVKEGPSESKENKENREKKGDREASKGRATTSRKGKGASRSRQARPEENGVEVAPLDKGTFNPADYTPEAGTGATQPEGWDTVANSSSDGTVAWRNTLEDWTPEDWSEDVGLSETKVFTSSCAPAAENHITPGQSLDLASLLQKPVGGGREPPSSSSPNLVFTNSHHHQSPAQQQPPSLSVASSTSYAHAALSSVLGAGFGDLGQAKRAQVNAGAQILEQLKGPGLGPLPSSQSTPPVSNQGRSSSIGRLPGLGAPVPPPSSSSWDIKPSESNNTSLSSQFSREFALQPEPSLVLSQLVQRHAGPSLALARQPSPPSQQQAPPTSAPLAPQHSSASGPAGAAMAAGAKPSAPSTGLDPQGGSTPQQQRGPLKGQKRRIPPTSKIPSTAVEMPGSADIPGLNLQFGALDFGSESALTEFGVVDNCVNAASRESTPAPTSAPPSMGAGTQSQTSLYSKPLSDPLGGPLSVALPLSTPEPAYHSSSVALPNLAPTSIGAAGPTNPPSSSSAASSNSSSVPSSSHFSTVGGSYDGTISPHTRLAFSQGKESTGASHASSSSSTPKPDSPSRSISANGHPATLLPRTSCSQLLGFVQPGTGPAFSQPAELAEQPCQQPFISFSFGLQLSHRKAPPNLSQGVPPLLPNQYIMGPGGLLPAYPIYGYEDLHMLQSRLPMPSLQDYYGITFPGPTALSNRDGNLANNPYSGEVTKFGRNDSTSPAPPTSLAAPQPPQGQSQGQSQAQPQPPQAQPQPQGQPQHHNSQQAFLPPGYSYTGLPYYPGVPGAVPSAAAFQYGPTMFVPPGGPGPASAKQHSIGLGLANPSASPFQQQTQQQPSGYSQHTFSSGYEELTAGPAGVGLQVSTRGPLLPLACQSALGGPGPLNPGAAPGGYAPAPFLHILPHQQPHSQLLHHHLAQDGQGGPGQRGQSNSLQQKSQVNKSSYGSSPYWAN